MTAQNGGGNRRNRSQRKNHGRPLLVLAAIGVVIVAAAVVVPKAFAPAPHEAPKPTATPAPQAQNPQSPTQVVPPTPAIALPKSCPANTIPQVNNPAKYGFCTPAGWGAWNDNNQNPLTQIIKARQGDSPVLQVTDFDRIQIVVSLNTTSPGNSAPAECRGAPNDSIDGLATHHCSAPLNPDTNPYHAARAEFWMIDMFQNQRFYITALVPSDATPDDDAMIDTIVHNVKPPTAG